MHTIETFELRNVDPDDVSDVLRKVEKSFGFTFNNEELKDIKTFGELCDIVAGKVEGEHKNDCTSQQAFYKLRHCIAMAAGSRINAITPDTNLQQLFPKHLRRKNIKAIEQKLGFKLNLLQPKHRIPEALVLLLLASIAYIFIDWRIGFTGIFLYIVTNVIANRSANEIPSQNLKQLVQKITRENYRKSRRNPATINRSEIVEQVKALFVNDLILESSVLHRKATFD